MANPETAGRTTTAILWASIGTDQRGRPLLDEPREIKLRFLEGSGEALLSSSGENTRPAIAVVAEDVPVRSAIWVGCLDEWYEEGSAGNNVNVLEVVNFEKVPDIRGRNHYREITLIRKGGRP